MQETKWRSGRCTTTSVLSGTPETKWLAKKREEGKGVVEDWVEKKNGLDDDTLLKEYLWFGLVNLERTQIAPN